MLVEVLDDRDEQRRLGALGREEALVHSAAGAVSGLLGNVYRAAASDRTAPPALPRPWRRLVVPADVLRHGRTRYVGSWNYPEVAVQMGELASEQLSRPESVAPFHAFRRILEALLADPRLPARPTWLDIGCGAGAYADLLEELGHGRFSYLGADYADAVVEVARQRAPRHRFERRDLFEPGALDGFDVVFASALLDVLPNPVEALDALLASNAPWVILHRQRIGSRTRVAIAAGYRGQRTYRSVLTVPVLEEAARRHERVVARCFPVERSVRSFILERR
jgi:SAM-dependent methyltransferase